MSQPMNPYDSPEAPRAGMSGTAKVLIGSFATLGVVVILCCGIGGVGMFWLARSVQHSVSNDPETIREVTAEIASIDIPPLLKPTVSLDLRAPVVGTQMMTMAGYTSSGDDAEKDGLFLMQFGGGLMDESKMRVQWRQSMQSSGQGDWENVDVEESEKFESEINGQPAQFTIGRGKDNKTKDEVWSVFGTFHGRGGPAMMFMKIRSSEFSKEQVYDLLKSIK